MLSGRGLCDELITRPEESYRMWCVVVCDLETSRMRRPWPTGGGDCGAENKQTNKHHMSFVGYLEEVYKMNSRCGGPDYRLLKFICQTNERISIKFYICSH